MKYFFSGCVCWGIVLAGVYAVRPKAKLASVTVETMKRREKVIFAAVLFATILICILPMSLSPIWNGEVPEHRNQYELLTESILEGHVYISYDDIDSRLVEMENPYDAALRNQLGVSFHWDHAFYNGRYYMYFGVVPVFLLFLPFRLITGTVLSTYHATQVFSALFIVAVFLIFLLLGRKFLTALTWAVYFPLAAAFSVMSVWYAAGAPALYCTAITSALCMEAWSLFFFMKAVWDSRTERCAVGFGMLGSLFGALAFGCRPSVALANLLAFPMLLSYLKGKKHSWRLLGQIMSVMLPYIIIGVLLMVYNYVRFEDPFEFGQSYQLTLADQSQYTNMFSQFNVIKTINGVMTNFLGFTPLVESFPYFSYSSVLINFPICMLAVLLLFRTETMRFLREKGLSFFLLFLVGVPILICIVQILMSPFLIERYRMDVYWLMGLLSYLSFGIFYQTSEGNRKRYGFLLALAAYGTILKAFMLWLVPNDSNFTALFPEYLEMFRKIIFCGFQ